MPKILMSSFEAFAVTELNTAIKKAEVVISDIEKRLRAVQAQNNMLVSKMSTPIIDTKGDMPPYIACLFVNSPSSWLLHDLFKRKFEKIRIEEEIEELTRKKEEIYFSQESNDSNLKEEIEAMQKKIEGYKSEIEDMESEFKNLVEDSAKEKERLKAEIAQMTSI